MGDSGMMLAHNKTRGFLPGPGPMLGSLAELWLAAWATSDTAEHVS